MFEFDETYSIDARDGERIYARLVTELDVVGFYKSGKLLFSVRARDTYDWASNLAVLTVYIKATDADKDSALNHLEATQ